MFQCGVKGWACQVWASLGHPVKQEPRSFYRGLNGVVYMEGKNANGTTTNIWINEYKSRKKRRIVVLLWRWYIYTKLIHHWKQKGDEYWSPSRPLGSRMHFGVARLARGGARDEPTVRLFSGGSALKIQSCSERGVRGKKLALNGVILIPTDKSMDPVPIGQDLVPLGLIDYPHQPEKGGEPPSCLSLASFFIG